MIPWAYRVTATLRSPYGVYTLDVEITASSAAEASDIVWREIRLATAGMKGLRVEYFEVKRLGLAEVVGRLIHG